jgi:PAS domain S-box-containing protein
MPSPRRWTSGFRREQKRLREALARVSESERRFRELADSAPVFIWTSDSSGLVDFINRSWLEFTGRSEREELGDSWIVGVHPDDADRVVDSWWSAFNRRLPWECEYRLQRRDGSYRWIVDRGRPHYVNGAFSGFVGTATDIHERKEMEDRLAVAYERDHEVAATLQRSLLPERLPAITGLSLEARYLPASRGTAIGGDWYDALELDAARVAVVVGDVVGHGLRAAAVMGQLRNAFRAYALLGSSPAETFGRLNKLLAVDVRDVMATAFYAVVDRDSGAVEYCSAGHPPALVVTPTGTRFLEDGRSMPLGTADFVIYRDARDALEPGATLLLYTDGLVERRDVALDERLERLAAVATGAGGDLGEVSDAVLEGVLGPEGGPDDVALLAVRLEPLAETLALELPADPVVLTDLRRRLGRFLQLAGASAEERYEITLTVCEAAANAIEHAYGPGDATFDLDVRLEDGEVVASVVDHGRWREERLGGGEGTRGRGLGIIRGLMDDVEVMRSEAGTTVRMRRKLVPSEAA